VLLRFETYLGEREIRKNTNKVQDDVEYNSYQISRASAGESFVGKHPFADILETGNEDA